MIDEKRRQALDKKRRREQLELEEKQAAE